MRAIDAAHPPEKLEEGQHILYRDIAAIIRCLPRNPRFRTVTNAWRKHLDNDYGLILICEGESFRVTTNHDKAELVKKNLKHVKRTVRKGLKTARRVDPNKLGEVERVGFEHNVKNLAAQAGMLSIGKNKNANLPALTPEKEDKS